MFWFYAWKILNSCGKNFKNFISYFDFFIIETAVLNITAALDSIQQEKITEEESLKQYKLETG